MLVLNNFRRCANFGLFKFTNDVRNNLKVVQLPKEKILLAEHAFIATKEDTSKSIIYHLANELNYKYNAVYFNSDPFSEDLYALGKCEVQIFNDAFKTEVK